MTAKEYREFLDYKCDFCCEHCKYRAWLGDEWGCIADKCMDEPEQAGNI